MTTLYLWGQLSHEDDDITHKAKPLTTQDLESGIVRPTQQLCYKFFVLSMIAFLIKVLSGAACAIDFVQGNLDLFLTDMNGILITGKWLYEF